MVDYWVKNKIGNKLQIQNSYSRGDVYRPTLNTNTSYGAFIGNAGGSEISYCFATGLVKYEGSDDPSDKGFAGSGSVVATNNYCYSGASGLITGTGATAKSEVELKDYTTYINWSYIFRPGEYWHIDGTWNEGYPYLFYEAHIWTGRSSSGDADKWTVGSNCLME